MATLAHYIWVLVSLALLSDVLANDKSSLKPQESTGTNDASTQLQQALADISSRDQSIRDLEVKLKAVTSELETTTRNLNDALESAEKAKPFEDELAICKSTLANIQRKLDKTQRKLDGLSEECDGIKEDCFACDDQLKQCEDQRNMMDYEKRGLNQVIDMEHQKKKDAEANNQELEKKLDVLTSNLETANRRLSAKQKHADILEKDSLALEEDIRKLNIKIKNCDYDAEGYEQRIKEYEAERNQWGKDITKMYDVYRDQERQIKDCKTGRKEVVKELAELRDKPNEQPSGDAITDQCESKLQDKEQDVIARLAGQFNCDQEFQAQRELVGSLKAVMATLNAQIDSLTPQESEATAELGQCQKYSRDVRSSFDDCVDKWYALLDKSADTTTTDPREEQSDRWKNCVEDLKLALEKAQMMEDKFSNCKATLDIVRGKLDETQGKLDGITEEHEEIKDDCSSCDDQLTDCEQQRGLLEYEKKAFHLVVDKEQEKRKKTEDKMQDVMNEMSFIQRGEAKYRQSFGMSLFALLVVATYHVYQWVAAHVHTYMTTARKPAAASSKKKGGSKGSSKKKD